MSMHTEGGLCVPGEVWPLSSCRGEEWWQLRASESVMVRALISAMPLLSAKLYPSLLYPSLRPCEGTRLGSPRVWPSLGSSLAVSDAYQSLSMDLVVKAEGDISAERNAEANARLDLALVADPGNARAFVLKGQVQHLLGDTVKV